MGANGPVDLRKKTTSVELPESQFLEYQNKKNNELQQQFQPPPPYKKKVSYIDDLIIPQYAQDLGSLSRKQANINSSDSNSKNKQRQKPCEQISFMKSKDSQNKPGH
jgi:hypothetical protein